MSGSGGKKRKEREGNGSPSEDDIDKGRSRLYNPPAPPAPCGPKKKKTEKKPERKPEVGDEVSYRSLQPSPAGNVLGELEFQRWYGHILHETREKMFLIERKDADGAVSSHDYVPAKNCHLMWEGRGD